MSYSCTWRKQMPDLGFVALTVFLFLVAWSVVKGCERL